MYYGEVQEGKHVDEILSQYFDESYRGVFVDVGAFDPHILSNSMHFEQRGWECHLIEANTHCIDKLRQYRKNVYHYAIADTNKPQVSFSVVNHEKACMPNWQASYSALEISEDYKRICGDFPSEWIETITVEQKTLNTLLEEIDIDRIDILSIDIEGGELNCLKGLDLTRYRPRVIVVENMTQDERIQEYIIKNEYILDKRIAYNEYYSTN